MIVFLVLLVGMVVCWTLTGPSRTRRTDRRYERRPASADGSGAGRR